MAIVPKQRTVTGDAVVLERRLRALEVLVRELLARIEVLE